MVAKLPAIATAGAILDAGTKLLSYFKTDFKLEGIKLEADEGALERLVAGRFPSHATCYDLLKWMNNSDEILKIIQGPDSEIVEIRGIFYDLSTALTWLSPEIAAGTGGWIGLPDEEDKTALMADMKVLSALITTEKTRLTEAIKAYTDFIAKLSDPSSDIHIRKLGPAIAYKHFAADKKILLLLIKLEYYGGGHYTKKNIWSGLFGFLPVRITGGTVVNYAYIHPDNSLILHAGAARVHSGYRTICNIVKSYKDDGKFGAGVRT